MISIIDYEMGNLGSVAKALAFLGAEVAVTNDPGEISKADAVILPGVGAMEYAYNNLKKTGMDKAVLESINTGRPFLGICLGMQLMFESSEEGNAKGLAVIPGRVRRFEKHPGLKIPHMGWNSLQDCSDDLLIPNQYYYFVHSYYCQPEDNNCIAASSSHGQVFTAAVRHKNMLLTQFHPEKSGNAGLTLLKSWLDKEVYLK